MKGIGKGKDTMELRVASFTNKFFARFCYYLSGHNPSPSVR